MFSPYYAAARRRGAADPLDHCAVNVALYPRAGQGRWAMTERGRTRVQRSADALVIGPSSLRWRANGALEIALDERCAPLPRRIRGTIVVHPGAQPRRAFAIDAAGRHRWQPIAPLARVDVALDAPRQAWSGRAYLDANTGDEPLETAFTDWSWSRAARADGGAAIHYDARRRDGSTLALALDVAADGTIAAAAAPPPRALAPTRWRIARPARGDWALGRTLEDGPFYARSLLRAADGGWAMHESLSLARFERRWVQALLPFRMPRRG